MEVEETDTPLDSAETTEETTEATRPLSPREQALALIDAQLEAQWRDGEEEEAEAETQPIATVPVEDQPRMVTVKVDGVETQVPESEVVASYQKQAFAQQTINEAKAEADRIIKQAQDELEASRATRDAPVTDEAILEKSKSIFTKMLEEGDINSAAEELASLISGKQENKTVDVDQVVQRVREQQKQDDLDRDYQKAKAMFDDQFADINTDPDLAAICNTRFQQEIQNGRMPSEAALAAGTATREWVQKLTGKTPAPVNHIADRAERKKTIENITPATGVSRSSATTTGDDPASIIAEMKKARGQV